jgi:hypothetical protein
VSQGVADTGGERINVPDSRLMCGRFLNKLPGAEIAHLRHAQPAAQLSSALQHRADGPGLTVRFNPETKERSVEALRRGVKRASPEFPLEDLGHATLDRSG